ncbi:MAG: hypothetical protein K8S24_03420 [Candidatus Aegiribacteria sp.]|nr:hypothetical protein [Candidatus Aegiribacteria sp.]
MAFLLLASMPVLFRKPSTTMPGLEEMAVHASALSLSDSAWSGSWWIWSGIEPPLPGCVAFGIHDLYPFRLITARDVQTGDVLIRIISPLSISSNENTMNRQNLHFTSFVQDSEALVLIYQSDSNSWPVNLFSIITNG